MYGYRITGKPIWAGTGVAVGAILWICLTQAQHNTICMKSLNVGSADDAMLIYDIRMFMFRAGREQYI